MSAAPGRANVSAVIHATSGRGEATSLPSRSRTTWSSATAKSSRSASSTRRAGLEHPPARPGHENAHGGQRIVRAMTAIEFGLYIPQVGFTWDDIRTRALVAEEAGFTSVWFMDHLYPPELPGVASFEAWTIATATLCRDHASARRSSGHVEHVPPSRPAGEDGGDARLRVRRAARPRHRERLLRARARARRHPVGLATGPVGAARGGVGDPHVDVHGRADDVRRPSLPADRRAGVAGAGAAATPADPRGRCG